MSESNNPSLRCIQCLNDPRAREAPPNGACDVRDDAVEPPSKLLLRRAHQPAQLDGGFAAQTAHGEVSEPGARAACAQRPCGSFSRTPGRSGHWQRRLLAPCALPAFCPLSTPLVSQADTGAGQGLRAAEEYEHVRVPTAVVAALATRGGQVSHRRVHSVLTAARARRRRGGRRRRQLRAQLRRLLLGNCLVRRARAHRLARQAQARLGGTRQPPAYVFAGARACRCRTRREGDARSDGAGSRVAGLQLCGDVRRGLTSPLPLPRAPRLREYATIYAGGSVAGAQALCNGACDVAINWVGGQTNARRDCASGFSFVNDAVLAILALLATHERVMFVSFDAWHPSGVEEAFYTSVPPTPRANPPEHTPSLLHRDTRFFARPLALPATPSPPRYAMDRRPVYAPPPPPPAPAWLPPPTACSPTAPSPCLPETPRPPTPPPRRARTCGRSRACAAAAPSSSPTPALLLAGPRPLPLAPPLRRRLLPWVGRAGRLG